MFNLNQPVKGDSLLQTHANLVPISPPPVQRKIGMDPRTYPSSEIIIPQNQNTLTLEEMGDLFSYPGATKVSTQPHNNESSPLRILRQEDVRRLPHDPQSLFEVLYSRIEFFQNFTSLNSLVSILKRVADTEDKEYTIDTFRGSSYMYPFYYRYWENGSSGVDSSTAKFFLFYLILIDESGIAKNADNATRANIIELINNIEKVKKPLLSSGPQLRDQSFRTAEALIKDLEPKLLKALDKTKITKINAGIRNPSDSLYEKPYGDFGCGNVADITQIETLSDKIKAEATVTPSVGSKIPHRGAADITQIETLSDKIKAEATVTPSVGSKIPHRGAADITQIETLSDKIKAEATVTPSVDLSRYSTSLEKLKALLHSDPGGILAAIHFTKDFKNYVNPVMDTEVNKQLVDNFNIDLSLHNSRLATSKVFTLYLIIINEYLKFAPLDSEGRLIALDLIKQFRSTLEVEDGSFLDKLSTDLPKIQNDLILIGQKLSNLNLSAKQKVTLSKNIQHQYEGKGDDSPQIHQSAEDIVKKIFEPLASKLEKSLKNPRSKTQSIIYGVSASILLAGVTYSSFQMIKTANELDKSQEVFKPGQDPKSTEILICLIVAAIGILILGYIASKVLFPRNTLEISASNGPFLSERRKD